MDKIEIRIDNIVGCTNGYEIHTEKGKVTVSYQEMKRYHKGVRPDGNNIQITLKEDNQAELAICKMVLLVPEFILLEKGLI